MGDVVSFILCDRGDAVINTVLPKLCVAVVGALLIAEVGCEYGFGPWLLTEVGCVFVAMALIITECVFDIRQQPSTARFNCNKATTAC